jgi:hypothetical protein
MGSGVPKLGEPDRVGARVQEGEFVGSGRATALLEIAALRDTRYRDDERNKKGREKAERPLHRKPP